MYFFFARRSCVIGYVHRAKLYIEKMALPRVEIKSLKALTRK